MSRAHNLYQLQTIDDQISEAKQYLRKIGANLGKSNALLTAEEAAETADKGLRQAQTKLQDVELEVKSLTDKISAQEKQLYSGKSMSAKEAANLQDEVASLKKRHGQREEALLEAMMTAEEAETAASQAKIDLSEAEEKWLADHDKLTQLKTQFEDKLTHLNTQRPTVLESISAADLAEYDRLYAKKSGKAVAAVKQGLCQGCNVGASQSKLQQARNGAQLAYCGSCGKILCVL